MNSPARDWKSFGELLWQLRRERRMTQSDLAAAADISVSTIATAERTGVAKWSPRTTVAVYNALRSKYRLLDDEDTAFKKFTGISVLADFGSQKAPVKVPPPDNFGSLSEHEQHDARVLINQLQQLYDRYGLGLTKLAVESISLLLTSAVGLGIQLARDQAKQAAEASGLKGSPARPTIADSPAVRGEAPWETPVDPDLPTTPRVSTLASPIHRRDTSLIAPAGTSKAEGSRGRKKTG